MSFLRRLVSDSSDGWRPDQIMRLDLEEQLLKAHMKGFALRRHQSTAEVTGTWSGSPRGYTYSLLITVPKGYPDECPTTYLTNPCPLYQFDGKPFPTGASHKLHTLGKDAHGRVIICTMRSEHWTAEYSLEKLVRKALLWIVGYECHLDAGKPISKFLMND